MRWVEPKSLPEIEIQHLVEEIGIHPIIARLLLLRGIHNYEEAKAFFNPDIRLLHDPMLMKDMGKALPTILNAIEAGQRIMIYGDYDVDGTTSVALLSLYLKEIGADILTYVPDRYSEGYGISLQGIDYAKSEKVKLIIAIDCGIRAIEQVEYAKQLGIDFIICDHHLPAQQLPKARAILNPKQTSCSYPYKELCACGVGFKLIQAIHARLHKNFEELYSYLDLVAIATAADIVPLTGENRILVAQGLKVLNRSKKRTGIQAILDHIDFKDKALNLSDLVYKIAPRINAAGRMKHAHHAVDLLVEQDIKTAKTIASDIENFNSNRRKIDTSITEEALTQIKQEQNLTQNTTVVYHEDWHHGVLGIVASRLIEVHYRPTIVFGKREGLLTASARSVKGYNIYEALNQCAHLLEKFGGHKYAAGLSMLPENFEIFKNSFEKTVSKSLPDECKQPIISIDAEINLKELIPHQKATFPKLYRIINRMRPFGPKNPNPVFITKNVSDQGSRKVGQDRKHLRIQINDSSTNQVFTGIGFNLADKFDQIDKSNFEIVYRLDENHWNGVRSLQLQLIDLR